MAYDVKAKSKDRLDNSDPVRSLREAYKLREADEAGAPIFRTFVGVALGLLFVGAADNMWGRGAAVGVALIAILVLGLWVGVASEVESSWQAALWVTWFLIVYWADEIWPGVRLAVFAVVSIAAIPVRLVIWFFEPSWSSNASSETHGGGSDCTSDSGGGGDCGGSD